jgi:DNA-binding transcriptional LysR family regulator
MLMAFDAAAKTGSFTAAAKRLHVTQGFISKLISNLENQLDVALFTRTRKTIHLTEAGQRYAQHIGEALRSIHNASLTAMSDPLSNTFNLAIPPTLGTRWLMPRLPEFLAQHPNIHINFVTKLTKFDFSDVNVDAAIHYGLPNWPNTNSTFLMGETIIPVASPTWIKKNAPQHPSDLSQLSCLNLSSRPDAWRQWLLHYEKNTTITSGMVFEQFSLLTQAAIAGLGAALLPELLIESELKNNELEVIFDETQKSPHSYYLITPSHKAHYASVIALREWLLKQCADMDP